MSTTAMKRTTTLDFIILGLIQENNLSGYKIRKTFEDTALGNFGGSPGTIYPALKRLETNHLISKQILRQGNKSEFSITPLGLHHLKTWLEQAPSEEEVKKNPELLVLKFAFMSPMIGTDRQIQFLDQMKKELKNYLLELQDYYENEKEGMPLTGQLAFEQGLMAYRSNIDWCEHAIHSLKMKK